MEEWNRGVTNKPENGDLCIPGEDGKSEIGVGELTDGHDAVVLTKDKLGFDPKKDNSYHPIKDW